ncbi:hypothetical protein TNCV_5032361 [Trichonephila clavipes]|nr:hypothetical protein TNCV_5032361 [Trichonephila clavipes]
MWNPQKAGYLLRNILGSKVVKTNLKEDFYINYSVTIFTVETKDSGSKADWGCGCPVIKVSHNGRYVMSSSPVPLKTHCAWQREDLPRAETSSLWCAVVVRRGSASSGVVHVMTMVKKLRGPSPKALVQLNSVRR